MIKNQYAIKNYRQKYNFVLYFSYNHVRNCEDMFIEELKEYKMLCDAYISNGSLKKYLKSVCDEKCLENYINVFIKHSESGKRVRAYLVKLGYELYGKTAGNETIPVSLSYELFQTGVLVHDDIIDNSRTRRFKPSMHVELGDNHDGMSKAICTGDMGLMCALDIIAKSDFPEDVKCKCISHQNRVFVSTIAGELKDIELSACDEYTLEDVIEMYSLKTAQYTISGPLVLGALLSGADSDDIKVLSEFGKNVGIAFQIRDDILGMFGDEEKVGKPVISDLHEGKKTVLSAYFKDNASPDLLKEFYTIYGNSDSGEDGLNRVRIMFVENGALDFSNNLCLSYTDKARKILCSMNVTDKCRALLKEMLEYMTSRNY